MVCSIALAYKKMDLYVPYCGHLIGPYSSRMQGITHIHSVCQLCCYCQSLHKSSELSRRTCIGNNLDDSSRCNARPIWSYLFIPTACGHKAWAPWSCSMCSNGTIALHWVIWWAVPNCYTSWWHPSDFLIPMGQMLYYSWSIWCSNLGLLLHIYWHSPNCPSNDDALAQSYSRMPLDPWIPDGRSHW